MIVFQLKMIVFQTDHEIITTYIKNQEIQVFESKRATVYTVEEIDEATSNFDETRKRGQGGCGRVYFGELGYQVFYLCV